VSLMAARARTLWPRAGTRARTQTDRGDPRWAIAAHVFRSSRRWALIWGAILGLYVIATVRAFTAAYPTFASRIQLAHSLQPFSMLLGLPRHAETVAGFTSWRVLTAAILISGIWGLLTSTGLLRGEEDAGRWEVLLAGQTTRRRAAGQALLGLGAALGAMFLLTALLTLAAAGIPGARFGFIGSLLFAAALVSGAAIFLAIGALASQLRARRGEAATVSAFVLGLSWIGRMIADSSPSLGWMRWLTPMGWIEELHPLQDAQPLALVPIVALVMICAFLTMFLAERRDLNASVIPDREGGPANARWLVGPFSLAMRVSRPVALGWLVGIAGYAAMEGAITRSATSLMAASPAIAATLGRLGVRRATEGFLGMAFFFDALLIAFLAASQIGAMRDEESSGRLDNLLVRPVTRVGWLAGRVCLSLSLLLLAGLGAGLFTWLGAMSQHVNESPAKLLEAGVNATIPGIFVLGAGVLVLGVRPRLSTAVAYGIVAWSFLVDLLGTMIKGADWLRDSSLFTHMALAPAANPDWGTAAVIVVLGGAAAAIGAIALRRRDIEYA
jgi:ABC-2 type transport system permease protein